MTTATFEHDGVKLRVFAVDGMEMILSAMAGHLVPIEGSEQP